ncbi:hypothetical protein PoB_006350000 [Plakobranchus ocellatus]|uniref:Uncharacterized protein n=1 Tax=Plakobranchus ocellatus TaxID=259542 RepID=A0AAV4CYW3_9GAST|nr:hypothetical protein PoB_006350000 [Plakobranchus ocellatus]
MTTTMLPVSYNESVRMALCSPMLVASDLVAPQSQQHGLDRPAAHDSRSVPHEWASCQSESHWMVVSGPFPLLFLTLSSELIPSFLRSVHGVNPHLTSESSGLVMGHYFVRTSVSHRPSTRRPCNSGGKGAASHKCS